MLVITKRAIMAVFNAGDRAIPKSLSNLFEPMEDNRCRRCKEKVYYAEKLGPVNGVIFHRGCFTCSECNQHLTMKTYYGSDDKEIYCVKHAPKISSTGLDANAVGIRLALNAPRTSDRLTDQIRSMNKPLYTGEAIGIQQAMQAQHQFQKRFKQQNERHHFPAYVVS